MRYIDEFITLKCAPDLLIARMFPNAKEITESMGAFQAIRVLHKDVLRNQVPYGDKTVGALVVGDGHKPRTGAMIACRTAWNVVSVDPLVKESRRFNRLKCVKKRIEDVDPQDLEPLISCEFIYIIGVHSHGSLKKSISAANLVCDTHVAISIPCCVPDDVHDPIHSYVDDRILSPCNRINIYGGRHGRIAANYGRAV